ncbi:MAG: hypothetical protein Q4C47_00575 [Planctomycetia bacterium]|nr:hypothetical protein [Planctomycetia bacterium]
MNVRYSAALIPGILFLCGNVLYGVFPYGTVLYGAETTRWSAKITRKVWSETTTPIVRSPDGWRLCEDEKLTGLNRREYYFTLEADGKDQPAPIVQVLWPHVEIAQVYGGDQVRRITDGVEFRPTTHTPPTAFWTPLPPFGAVNMVIFHNVEGLQAGPYRDLAWPGNQIAAHLNYLFAAREMMRLAGFTESEETIDANINLYGFETNYPNGHRDFPPHFHIMTMWDDWREIQATHFILAEDGTITRNDHYVVRNGVEIHEESVVHHPGEEIPLTDRSGSVSFTLRILPDGTGVEMKIPGEQKEYRILSENAVESVTCEERANASSPWKRKTVSRVTDDPERGVLTVVTEESGSPRTETWRYVPDTGALIRE